MLYIDMFGVRMVGGILCKCYASLIVIHDECWSFLHIISHIRQKMPKPNRFLSIMASSHVLCYVIDNAMAGCFLHFYELTPMPTKNMYPMVDRQSFESPAQSVLQKPLKTISLPMRHNLKSKVPFKYLMMRFTAIQCSGSAFDMNWLTIFIANVILALVASIAYMRDLTLALYGTPSISLCTFTHPSFKGFYNFEFTSNGILTGLHSFMLKCLRISSM